MQQQWNVHRSTKSLYGLRTLENCSNPAAFAGIFASEPMTLPEIDHVPFLQSMRRHFSPVKFLAANTILLIGKWNHACSLLVYVISVITSGRQRALTAFRRYYLTKNKLSDGMIKQLLRLGYRKISWFVSVSQINYLPKPAQPRPIIANYLFIYYNHHYNFYYRLMLKPEFSLTNVSK